MADTPNPLLPPEPWYTSSVQRAQFFALLTSAAAVIIQLFDFQVDVQLVNAKIGLVAQLANMAFTGWGIFKRQTSTIQPLTMTAAGAAKKADTAQLDPATMALKDTGAVALAAGQLAGEQPDVPQNSAPTLRPADPAASTPADADVAPKPTAL
jgi:hypothetical protein